MNLDILRIVPGTTESTLNDVPPSVLKILRGALMEISSRGTRRLTMSDISERSGVSRGTLYRYFTTKDEVLAAVSEFVSVTFEHGILEEAARHSDPIERLRAVMRYHADYTGTQTPDGMIEIEPTFLVDFFRSHFDRHTRALLEALGPSFDAIEHRFATALDRETIVETLIRLQLSRLLVPADDRWSRIWNAAPDMLIDWVANHHPLPPA